MLLTSDESMAGFPMAGLSGLCGDGCSMIHSQDSVFNVPELELLNRVTVTQPQRTGTIKVRFAVGLAPAGLHLPYIDREQIKLKEHRGPSSMTAINLCAAVASSEVLTILLKRKSALCAGARTVEQVESVIEKTAVESESELIPSTEDPDDLSAESILRRADAVRNPQLDYTVTVSVTTSKPNSSTKKSVYEVLVKGREKTVIKTLEPVFERGRVLLMLDNNLWAYLPNISKPLRISLQERLTGEVANGDLARTNFSGDYSPEIDRVDSIGETSYYVLNLTANSDDVTYARAMLWVEQDTFHPYQAEFYALSGRLLKTCTYERYQLLGQKMRPTRLVMRNALATEKKSVLEYDSMRIDPLPDKYFTKDYMKRLTE